MAENEVYAIPRDDNNYDGSARFFPEDNSSDDRVDFVLIYDGTASDPIANEISPLSIAEGGFNRIEFWTGTPGVGSLTQFVNFTANN